MKEQVKHSSQQPPKFGKFEIDANINRAAGILQKCCQHQSIIQSTTLEQTSNMQ